MLHYFTLFGHAINLYDFFNNFGTFASIAVLIPFRRQLVEVSTLPAWANTVLNKKRKTNLFRDWFFFWVFVAFFFAIIFILINLSAVPITVFFLGNKDSNYFPNIFVGPVYIFLLSVLVKNSPLKTLDTIAPVMAFMLIFFKMACFCDGCCNGVEWENGMWNTKTERMEFPVQLVEIACAAVMFIILMVLLLNKKKQPKPGLAYPLFMLMYCGSRFVSEFWRDDYPDIWGPLKSYHFQCIIGFVEGLVFLFIVLKWGERSTVYF